jgi:hypothetical protein
MPLFMGPLWAENEIGHSGLTGVPDSEDSQLPSVGLDWLGLYIPLRTAFADLDGQVIVTARLVVVGHSQTAIKITVFASTVRAMRLSRGHACHGGSFGNRCARRAA